jgi:hypothetical protein
MRKATLILILFGLLLAATILTAPAVQNIKVNPDGVNVNANGATVVFLTFGPLASRVPAEGCWCGELIPAAPDFGFKCDPATLFGCLPARSDFSSRSGGGAGFTDIMSIPPSVSRRAYQAAEAGSNSAFFYVRRFVNPSGGPDEFVPVTCRMSGGGARTPFALTDVKLSFDSTKPVMLVKSGERLPTFSAVISYNGTGRLRGRWEVVLPGDEPPTERDLLTEAALPIEERAAQRRYTQVSRFNVFLQPGTKYTLPGPDSSKLPNTVEGQYLLLLRIEATDDKEGDSNLAVVEVGSGVVHSGAVAGFPIPPLRYYVGSGTDAAAGLTLLFPSENAVRSPSAPIDFSWTEAEDAAFFRLELVDSEGRTIVLAILPRTVGTYRGPSWIKDKTSDGALRWRVIALDQTGDPVAETPWRNLRLQ